MAVDVNPIMSTKEELLSPIFEQMTCSKIRWSVQVMTGFLLGVWRQGGPLKICPPPAGGGTTGGDGNTWGGTTGGDAGGHCLAAARVRRDHQKQLIYKEEWREAPKICHFCT